MARKKKTRKTKKERAMIFLDGSNFYHRLKDPELNFKDVLYFDYKEFAKWLANKRKIGFAHRPSFGMQNHADISRLLIKSELEKFIPKV